MKVCIHLGVISLRGSETDWNALIEADDVLVLYTRNTDQTKLGTFERVADPRIASFTQFKDFVETLDRATTPRLAMFCTGGIRCEKASIYMLSKGFDEAFHPKGGM